MSGRELFEGERGREPTEAETSSQGPCETTLTERFRFDECVCGTYEGNLGPCRTFLPGANTRCVYCDHRIGCHGAIAERFSDDA